MPETGNYPAIQMDDGTIFVDTSGVQSTHVNFIKQNNIPIEHIANGGFVNDGVYDSSASSDTIKYIEQEMAKKRAEAKRATSPFPQKLTRRKDVAAMDRGSDSRL